MAGCRLIVHADDLGLSEAVNEGVIEAHRRGIVTSASVVACGAAFDDAVRRALATPSLDVGVHLTLVEERPVLDAGAIPSLVTASGRFHASAGAFLKRYLLGRIRPSELQRELDAQIRRVQEAGIEVTHLDSHQHIHALPAVWEVVRALARAHGIAWVRYPRERPPLRALASPGQWRRLAQLGVLDAFCARLDRSGVRHPDRFFGFMDGGRLDRSKLEAFLERLPAGRVCELMCHPAAQDREDAYAHWDYRGPTELKALTDPELPQRLRDHHVELVSYRDL